MFNFIVNAAISLYRRHCSTLFNFERFFQEYESTQTIKSNGCVLKIEQALQDEELKDMLLKSNEIIKILHFLYQSGNEMEFCVPFLLEVTTH